ncbi:hypothetical protein IQ22_04133 [Pseudomonas duriflava]|uniref:Uncharacterized protein n=1 Tax=Pseudomonas duriflava TaxID=459528 RepID=A0A562PX64_9PSED|nr:hypothetical protein [Pseudomonas duriflava]TWI48999.1 hypothetical protein IQ22_04133 [Pseudomonas duriflava]
MNLYHYTSVTLAGSIFNTSLWLGQYLAQNTKKYGHCVWLTTHPEPKGHGLLTGEKLSIDDVQFLQEIGAPAKNLTTHNKTQVRITINSEKLDSWSSENLKVSGLIKYSKFSKQLGESAIWRKTYGLSCVYKLEALSDDELRRYMKQAKTMEDTWYLYFGSIPPELFEEVSFQTSAGFVAYDFETHGRKAYESCGLHVIEKPLLAQFHELCPPLNKFDIPYAAVFCANHESQPSVSFQGRGATWDIDMKEFHVKSRLGELPSNIDLIVDWTRRNQDELMSLWPAAVASYNRYYPDKPASL